MKPAMIPVNEKDRLEELYSYDILDTAYEETFNQIVQLASAVCDSPISLITLLDKDRQWFKAKKGMDSDGTSRDVSFCSHVILDDQLMEVEDAHADERFFDNPLVTGDPNIRFYAGVPIITKKGLPLGALCVIDNKPKNLSPEQKFVLKVLAGQAMQLIELHKKHVEINTLVETHKKILSIVSHDVRNPLGAIKSILELRNDDIISSEEADEMLVVASQQIDNTLDMISNLVDWGRMQIQAKALTRKDTNIEEVVQRCFNAVSAASSLKNNELILNDEAKSVYTDSNALEFILRNLITNANKYTEDGSITVSSKKEGEHVAVTVADTGIGMSEEKLNSIFGSVKNFSEPGTKNEPGSGLGLILVKEFLDKIHATISLKSTPGKGTEVTIVL